MNSWVENATQTPTHYTQRERHSDCDDDRNTVLVSMTIPSNCVAKHPNLSTSNWMLSYAHFFTFAFFSPFGRVAGWLMSPLLLRHASATNPPLFSLSLRLIWWPCNVETSSENICFGACVSIRCVFVSIRSNFFVTFAVIEWIRKKKKKKENMLKVAGVYEKEPAMANKKSWTKFSYLITSVWRHAASLKKFFCRLVDSSADTTSVHAHAHINSVR